MFSQEVIAQSLNGTVRFGASRLSAQIFRHADLLSDLFCTVRLPSIKTVKDSANVDARKMYCDFAALALISEAECEVGGSRIDRLFSSYMFAMHDLAVSASHRRGIEVMLGNFLTSGSESDLECIVPLPFWFTLNPGSSLNLVGMQYHEVRITLSLAKLESLTRYVYSEGTALVRDALKGTTYGDDSEGVGNANLGPLTDADLDGELDLRLYGKYTYLDADERKRFATNSSESLLVVSQVTTETIPKDAQSTNVRVAFNHPVSELIVLPQSDWAKERNMHFNFHSSSDVKTWTGADADAALYYNPVKSLILKLNNHEMQAAAPGSRYHMYTAWRSHTAIPEEPIVTIPFALHCENTVQPSGSLNMSRVDNAVVEISWDPAFTKTAGSVAIFGRNWNVFRQTGGMGGIAYSN